VVSVYFQFQEEEECLFLVVVEVHPFLMEEVEVAYYFVFLVEEASYFINQEVKVFILVVIKFQ
jgi:hypothetical protein